MKYFKVLIEIPAENEDDFKEQLETLDSYELEWWCRSKWIKKFITQEEKNLILLKGGLIKNEL